MLVHRLLTFQQLDFGTVNWRQSQDCTLVAIWGDVRVAVGHDPNLGFFAIDGTVQLDPISDQLQVAFDGLTPGVPKILSGLKIPISGGRDVFVVNDTGDVGFVQLLIELELS